MTDYKQEYAKLIRVMIAVLSNEEVFPALREQINLRADKLKNLTTNQLINIIEIVIRDEDLPVVKLAILSTALRRLNEKDLDDNPVSV